MTGTLLIANGVVALANGLRRADVLCEGGRIVAVEPEIESRGVPVFDATGLTLGPGFVDIHVHGGGGSSFFEHDASAITAYAEWAPSVGVTSFLVSTVGPNADDTSAMLSDLAPAIVRRPGAAEPLGFHLEGPFINPDRCGAFHPDSLRDASREEFWRFQDSAQGHIRQVTFAPELPGGAELAAAILSSGAVAAMGHTDATVAEAQRAFGWGVRHVTHLFNAMRPLHHRDGGAAAAALLESSVSCEVISDGKHVSPEMLRLAYRILGPNRFVAVTDNLALAGGATIDSSFGSDSLSVRDGVAVRGDGTIVGGVATMDQHFQLLCRESGAEIASIFRLCSTNGARVVGAGKRKGCVDRGFDADLVLLDVAQHVRATVCGGKLAFLRDRHRAPWSTIAA